ncbi:MAG: acyltransferase, partial [Acidobacteriota bacterium]|nr:acyltransferase [Acidobacteriota bacterium]
TFHVNWLESRVSYLPGSWDILWSLSVEEVFYLAYPVLCRFFRNRWLPVGLASALIFAGPFFRTVLAANEIGSDYAYLANMDGIAIGCIAAALVARVRVRSWWGAAIMLYVVTVRVWLPKAGLDVTVLEIGTALAILGMTAPSEGSGWTVPLRWLGRNSYEVYLTHMFVVTTGTTLYTAMGKPIAWAPAWFAGMFVVAAILGDLIARLYSEPLNRSLRRDRTGWPARRNRTAAASM